MASERSPRPPEKGPEAGAAEPAPRPAEKRPAAEAASAALHRKERALARKAPRAPRVATVTPPSTGPARMPAERLAASRPLAQARSPSPTRFGTAAEDAGKNGASASETSSVRPTISQVTPLA